MRILYVGNAQGFENAARYYLFPQRLINGFTRAGHTVYVFNDRDVARHSNIFRSSKMGQEKMNAALIQTCQDYRPDFILLSHCEKVHNHTLDEIRTFLPETKIAYRNVDPLCCEKNCQRIRNRAQLVDAVFVTTAGEALKEFASPRAFAAFLPNPVDSAIDTGKAFANDNPQYDLFFAASSLGADDRRRGFLQNLQPLLDPSVRFNLIGAGINDKRLFGPDFIDALNNAKMGLILNKTENFYLYASDRMSQYLGNGLLTLCSKEPKYTDVFSDDELVEYENEADLAEKILFFKNNPETAQRIAQKAYTKAHKIFASETIANYILDLTFGSFPNSDYEWPAQKYGPVRPEK